MKIKAGKTKRVLFFCYGLVAYLFVIAAFIYAFAFMGNELMEKSIDSEPRLAMSTALAIDLFLLIICISILRISLLKPSEKKLTDLIPAPLKRSCRIFIYAITIFILIILWQPIGFVVWKIEDSFLNALLTILFTGGWILVLLSTFLINHLSLFGIRQVWYHLNNKPYTPLQPVNPVIYRVVRHPFYIGLLLGCWAAPLMTVAHLLFAIAAGIYVFIGIRYEGKRIFSGIDYVLSNFRKNIPEISISKRKKVA